MTLQFNIGDNPPNEIDIHSQVLHKEGANVQSPCLKTSKTLQTSPIV